MPDIDDPRTSCDNKAMATKEKGKTRRLAKPVNDRSADVTEERALRVAEIVPEALAEGRIDFERLREALGDYVDERPERYTFSWAGRRNAIQLLQTPTRATLVPAPKESVEWETTDHLFIEGDNLEVLKLLYKPYFGRVKLMYIDPPFNTGKDFVYRDDYSDPLDAYLRYTRQRDEAGNLLTSNPETSGRYHSSWLSMMYPRLFLARQLLREDGVIFVSIDDHELHNLKLIMNEIFGEENALPILVWNRGHSQQQGIFKEYHEYLVPYARSREALEPFSGGDGEIVAGAMKKISKGNPAQDFEFPKGTRCEALDATEFTGTWGGVETVTLVNGRFRVDEGKLADNVVLRAGWTQMNQMKRWFAGEEDVRDTRGQKVLEFYFSGSGKLKCRKERARITPSTVLTGYGTQSKATEELADLFGERAPIDYPKPLKLIGDLVRWVTQGDGDIVVDFFAGAATTTHAVFEVNREDGGDRRAICVQLPEPTPDDSPAREMGFQTVAEIGKERLRRAVQRISKELEKDGNAASGLDLGFRAFKLDESSLKPWPKLDPKDENGYVEQVELFVDRLVEKWSPTNLLWEVAIKEGYGLASQIEKLDMPGSTTVYRITDADLGQTFLACLDDELDPETIEALQLTREDLFVCLDRALSDEQAANLAVQCRLKSV
jgi:adenine-specific DNA-methyltransferase